MRRGAGKHRNDRKLAYAVALSLACASFCFGGFAPPSAAFAAEVAADALPTGGEVAAGEATIGAPDVVDGKQQLTIDQTTNRAIIDWTTFNVGSDAAVTFQTWTRDATGARIVDPTAMTLNRVASSGGLSTIAGRITSTGVFLLTNPNGVLFADDASVDAAGIVVSTAAIDARAFMDEGCVAFAQDKHAPNADIIINGSLMAKTDEAKAKAALANAVVNVGHPVGTTLSVENNVIRIVADGSVNVGTNGRLQATSAVSYTDGATGETAQREGTIVLRADANADNAQHGGVSEHVVLDNASKDAVQAQQVFVQFDPVMKAGEKDYGMGADEATVLRGKFTALQDGDVSMLVNNAGELQNMERNLGGSYALGADIQAAGTSTRNDAKSFAPIGSAATPFTGTFDGNGYRIYDLSIQRTGTDGNNAGLFGVADGADIRGVTLVDAKIHGNENVGGLVGLAQNGTVLRADVVRKRDGSARDGTMKTEATDNVSGSASVGGLVGMLKDSTICGFSQNAATVSGKQAVGGLAGSAVSAEIFDSSNTGYTSAEMNLARGQSVGVITASSGRAGGLVGDAKDTVIEAREARAATYNAGQVTGGAIGRNVGGLVGYLAGGRIRQAYNTNVLPAEAGTPAQDAATASPYGRVTGGTNVGGLVGMMADGSTLTTAFHAGDVTGDENVGGLVGTAGKSTETAAVTITQSYHADNNTVTVGADGIARLAHRDAHVTGRENVGGLVGMLDNGNITQAYSWGEIVMQPGASTAIGLAVGYQNVGCKIGINSVPADGVYVLSQKDALGNTLPTVGAKASKWSPDAVEARTSEEFMQNSCIPWTGNVWLVKDGATPPLLRAFLRPVSLDRQYRYDGNVHDVTDIPGVYRNASVAGGTGWRDVATDGVQTLDELGEPYDAAGWLVMSGAADDSTDASSVYTVDAKAFWSPQLGVDTSTGARILIAAQPKQPEQPTQPTQPTQPAQPTEPTEPRDADSTLPKNEDQLQGIDAFFERLYEFAIRDHRRTRDGRTDVTGFTGAPGRGFLRYDEAARFLTLEDTVLRPSGRTYFGGARLEALGTQPLLAGTTLATALPEIVLEKAEDPQEKAGNEAFDSE